MGLTSSSATPPLLPHPAPHPPHAPPPPPLPQPLLPLLPLLLLLLPSPCALLMLGLKESLLPVTTRCSAVLIVFFASRLCLTVDSYDIITSRWSVANGRPIGVFASINNYPGYSGSLTVTGSIYIADLYSNSDAAGITIHGTLTGLEPNATGGIHVHTGVTCSSASEVYGHYYDSSYWASDPWTTTYSSDGKGTATIASMELSGFSITGTYPIAGRAFVVHASDGTRIGCGVLEATPGHPALFHTYPGYSGSYENASSTLILTQSTTFDADTGAYASTIHFNGTIAGLEASSTGGIHIHEGYSCSDSDAVGGHYYTTSYWDTDPWTTTYTTDSSGAATVDISMDDFYLTGEQYLASAYRTMVIHLSGGTRVLCAVIGQPQRAVANVGRYPGYTGALEVNGTVSFETTDSGDLAITGTLSGLSASTTGGIHVHVGFTCEDQDAIYGHYFGDASIVDPWASTTYTSQSQGVASFAYVVSNVTLSRESPIAGRAFVVHDGDGTRIGCGIVASTSGEVVNLGLYPSYTGPTYFINGTLLIEQTYKNLTITGTLVGLEASTSGGAHVHSGWSCDDADAVQGHYFQEGTTDPWDTLWYSDSNGAASLALSIPGYSLNKAADALLSSYRTFVIHLSGGTRAACGVIGSPGTAVASLSSYPGYSGELAANGTVVVADDDQGIVVYGTLIGLEPNVEGGVHIHTGFSCESADDVGGHYYDSSAWSSDPWLDTTYCSDQDGNAQIKFSVEGFSLSGMYPVAGRAFVVHSSSGTRIGCGLLQSSTGEVASISTYPDSSSDTNPLGTVVVSPSQEGIGVHIMGSIAGLAPFASGQMYLGAGYNVDIVGGPGSELPGTAISWTSNAQSAARIDAMLSGITLDDTSASAFHVIIIEDSNGIPAGTGSVSSDGARVVSVSSTFSPTSVPSSLPTLASTVQDGEEEDNDDTSKNPPGRLVLIIIVVVATAIFIALAAAGWKNAVTCQRNSKETENEVVVMNSN